MTSRTYKWNWAVVTGDKNDGKRVRQSAASLTSRAFPARGSWDVTQLSSIHGETLNDVIKLFSQWNTMVQPILKSLPAGGSDQRWSGLRTEIDALNYGIDGTTLFVFQDASPNNFDGRYWYTDDKRPFTIAEVLEDHEGRLTAAETTTTATSTTSSLFDDTDLWNAIGWGKKPGSGTTSASGSLHGTQLLLQDNLEKIAKDMYGVSDADPAWPSYLTTWNGAIFKYGIYEYLSYLTDLHGVDMVASEDPWDVAHASFGAHTHPQTEVLGSGYSTLARGFGLPANLELDMQRLRYEIEYTRGSSWNSGVLDGTFTTNHPSSGNAGQTLSSHINFVGSGTADTTNPHGVDYTDTGADTIFGYNSQYTGQGGLSDVDPFYSSTTYITQGNNLTVSIGDLDSAISTVIGSLVSRADYYEDRSVYSEEWRVTHPVLINHGYGRKPQVQVLDQTPPSEDLYGQYQALDQYVNFVHVDDNTLEVWTNAASVQIILIG